MSQKEKAVKIGPAEVERIMDRFQYPAEIREIIKRENLLPVGLLSRLQAQYPQYSALMETREFWFPPRKRYTDVRGFYEVVRILNEHGVVLDHLDEREFFIRVYRFLATSHVLNIINWDDYENDSLYRLVFPQPGMISDRNVVQQYVQAKTEEEKKRIVSEYRTRTNPHDGKQQLNKPWFVNEFGELEIVHGAQHKYPQVLLIFDKTTQSCFAFCNYCFRHAQVRADHDMFIQEDIDQIHRYLRRHKEVTDVLITGGDAGFIPPHRLEQYVRPFVEDPDLGHIRTLRFGSRALTYYPELILTPEYERTLNIFQYLVDNGIQVAWMAHFSTPRELLNPTTIAAVRRLRSRGVIIRSQSPAMKHISLFVDEQGKIDVDRSAQNWIDLANIFAMLGIGFHSMYFARPTGEYHYFSVTVDEMNRVFSKIYRSLPSISRPSRYITQTSSAGKIALLGTTVVNGQKAFVLKFNEARNMEWMDEVFLAKFDPEERIIAHLEPFEGKKYFFEDELQEIERELERIVAGRTDKVELV